MKIRTIEVHNFIEMWARHCGAPASVFIGHLDKMLEDVVAEKDREIKQANEAIKTLAAGEPLGPLIGAQTIVNQSMEIKRLREALLRMVKMHELMMSQIDHKRSFYDADTIREMNEAPIQAKGTLSEIQNKDQHEKH